MTEKLKQIRNFISEKISQDEFKIVDYDNSFKIHSNESGRQIDTVYRRIHTEHTGDCIYS